MKKLIVGVGVVGVTVMSIATAGTGVAAADDYAGKTYADASSALSGASLKGVIAGRVGDTLPTDQCVVTHSEKAPWIKGNSHGHRVAVPELQRHGGVGHLARKLGGKPRRQGSHCGGESGRCERPGDCCGQPEAAQALVSYYDDINEMTREGGAPYRNALRNAVGSDRRGRARWFRPGAGHSKRR